MRAERVWSLRVLAGRITCNRGYVGKVGQGALYLNKLTEVAAYELTWNDVTSRALDETLSGKSITGVMEAFTRG
ncbi:hypothetical protein [Micromonospora sp. HUAS LYJ1]|uniref:hypothetical protein n=1 Tax=Micromonospora sp. HUAS LYJ1 TaxID=3061626 RepID=UPI002671E124|nr:hypothetical protein [Micromonospora sp. HUAS LYJ1]WKU03789.1 hypothetical protein Q2K16_23545 [Micromonospora sp. HUAS LYJ1]